MTKYHKVIYSELMNEYQSTKQIAKLLGVKTFTIRRWIDKGLLPAYKIGKELRIKRTDLDKFISDRRVKL